MEDSDKILKSDWRANKLLEKTIERMTDAFYVLDCEWRFAYLNTAAEDKLRIKRGEVLGKVVWEVFPKAIDSEIAKQYHLAMSKQIPVCFETTVPTLKFRAEIRAYPSSQGLTVFFNDITERRKSEEEQEKLLAELQRRTAEQDAILSLVSVGVGIFDCNGQYVGMNPAAWEILGFSENETSMPYAERIDMRKVESWDGVPVSPEETALGRALKGETVKDLPARIHRNGEIRWVLVSATPIQANEGKLLGAVVTFVDITEHKRVEEKINRHNTILKLIGNIYENAIQCKTIEELGKECLNIVESITGSTLGFIGEIGSDGFHHNFAFNAPGWDSGKMSDKTGQNRVPGTSKTQELYHRILLERRSVLINAPSAQPESIGMPEGHPCLTAFLGVPFVHEGKVVGMIGVGNREGGYRDEDRETLEALTPTIFQAILQKKAELALKESEARFNAFMDSSPALAWMKDEFGRHVYMNKTWESVYGQNKEDWVGRTDFIDRMLSEEAEKLKEIDGEVLRTGKPIQSIEKIGHGDGIRYCQSIKFLFQSVSGQKFTGGIAIDITKQKQIEEALRKANDQKDEFLAILSHELRNPLASINNCLSILERVAQDGAQAKRAKDIINRQVGQLARLIDDLLDITRINQNKIKLKRERHELNELVLRSVEDHRPLFDINGVFLEMELSPAAIFVNGDKTRLIQIIGNLLHNSAKFTDRGGSTRISTQRDSLTKQAVIRAIDTGVGIAHEMIPGLFQPFFQADTSLARSKGGLGLGLTLSKGLIELHGGDISVHSAGLGKGTEFIVRLPLDDTNIENPPNITQEAPHCNRRVLIIDDNLDLARSLYELLELCEHEVAVAYDGFEGLEKAHEFKPEVVLCDIGLPGMNGYEVAKAFRTDETLKDVFLVALTGYAQSADQRRASEAGFEKHLAKPVDLNELERLLAEIPTKFLGK